MSRPKQTAVQRCQFRIDSLSRDMTDLGAAINRRQVQFELKQSFHFDLLDELALLKQEEREREGEPSDES